MDNVKTNERGPWIFFFNDYSIKSFAWFLNIYLNECLLKNGDDETRTSRLIGVRLLGSTPKPPRRACRASRTGSVEGRKQRKPLSIFE